MGMLHDLSDGTKMHVTNMKDIIRDVTNDSYQLLIKWLHMRISHCDVLLEQCANYSDVPE
jgi:hypothetical protein